MPTEYYQKNTRHVKGILLKKKKTRSEAMVASDIRVFLKKKKKRSVSINVNATKIFIKIKNKE